jgi:hypothetical protein
MYCLRLLKHWDRGFKSYLKHGCLCAFILCLCCPVFRYRPCDGMIPVQGVLPKAWTVFVLSNTGIVGSNPTWSMDVCVLLFCLCAVLWARSGLATGWSPVQEYYRLCKRLRNWKSGQGTTKGCTATDEWMNKWIHVRHCSLSEVFMIQSKRLEERKIFSSARYVFLSTSEAPCAYAFETFILKRIL